MSERPQIVIGELPATVDAAIEALAPLDVFQRAGALVDVVREAESRGGVIRPEGSPRIRLLPAARLKELLELAAEWNRLNAKGELERCRPPKDVAAAVEARGEWAHVRQLLGMIEWPALRPDGTVLTARGYDAATGLLCEPTVRAEVPEHPTLEDAQHAIELFRELTVDFPFGSEAHRGAWLAALLTVLARAAIDGPTPLTLIDANARGAGKTMLAELIGTIVTGRILSRRTVPDDAAEWRKSMLAIAIAADPVLLIDNVTRMLASDVLDSVLTGTVFRERALGRNEELSVRIRTVFLATANNATLSPDLVRRTLHVRLESPEEQPERRTGWQYPDLLGYARDHRAQLLGAALTLLRAYVVAGRPAVELAPMGSYEAWSAVVRAALVWAGLPDPAATQDALREGADLERDAISELLRTWHGRYRERAVTVAEVLGDASRQHPRPGDGVCLDCPGCSPNVQAVRDAVVGPCDARGGLPSPRRLGIALAKLRGRIVDGRWLERGPKGERGVSWRVRTTGAADSADSPDSVSDRSRARTEDPSIETSRKQSQQSHESQDELPGWGVS